jgi:hypothetical protein
MKHGVYVIHPIFYALYCMWYIAWIVFHLITFIVFHELYYIHCIKFIVFHALYFMHCISCIAFFSYIVFKALYWIAYDMHNTYYALCLSLKSFEFTLKLNADQLKDHLSVKKKQGYFFSLCILNKIWFRFRCT